MSTQATLGIAELFDVSGKVAVVTGGSRGIGRMIAEGFVRNGVRTYITARKAEACDATAAELSQFGECISIPADLSAKEEVDRLAGEIAGRENALHILVNNAGATWGAPIDEFPEAGFDKVLDINVKAPFLLTQALLPQIRAAASADDPGRVIMVGSVDGLKVPLTDSFSYSASKAGIHHMARHIAHRVNRDHITVNCIAPGPFDSKMMAFALDDPETRAAIAGSNPLGRVGRPEDMAGVAIFLSSRAGSYLTGAVIPVDGGSSSA
jgi:NAD(P)-dependent dehydrogenase (short-subunit alcohol dehydrogenase family)